MYKKLLKYEFKATYREAGILLIIFLGLSLLSMFLISIADVNSDYIALISLLQPLLFVVFLGMAIITITEIRVIFKVFWNGLFGKSSYLLFSVPATSKQIIISKFLITLFWLLTISIVYVIGIYLNVMVLVIKTGNLSEILSALGNVFDGVFNYFGLTYLIDLFLLIGSFIGLILFVSVFSNTIYKGGKKIIIALLLVYGYSLIQNTLGGNLFALIGIFSESHNPNAFTVGRILSYIFSIGTIVGSYFFSVYALDHKLEVN